MIVLAACLFALGALLIAIYPYRPANLIVWAVVFFSALPLYLALEYLGRFLFDPKLGNRLHFAALRIAYGLCVMLLVVGAGIYLQTIWGEYFATWGT